MYSELSRAWSRAGLSSDADILARIFSFARIRSLSPCDEGHRLTVGH